MLKKVFKKMLKTGFTVSKCYMLKAQGYMLYETAPPLHFALSFEPIALSKFVNVICSSLKR